MKRILLAAAISVLPTVIHAQNGLVQGLLEICGKESPERTIEQLEASGWVRTTDNDFGDYASMTADSWTGMSAESFVYWTGSGSSRPEL
ncbi:MAG: hypothetical protein ACRC6I_06970, partial [Paracoccaceae bacterium]